jgi:hypothetical protein
MGSASSRSATVQPSAAHILETWFRVIRTAITRQAITVQTADGRTGDQPRLIHTSCHAATQTARQPVRHA